MLLLIIVIYAALKEGLRSALLSATIAEAYFLYIYSISGKPLHYSSEDLWRIIIIGITLHIMAILIGSFRKQIHAVFETEQLARMKAESRAEKLRKSEERKEEFLAMASHELKTPITSIKLGIYALSMRAKKEDNPHLGMHLARMDEQVNNLTRLVNDLLDISKMTTGKLVLNKEPVDIDSLINEKIKEISAIDATYRIVKKGRITRYITVDRARIGQVIINLLTNAMRYSPNSNNIIVSVKEEPAHIKFSVQDFGIGIAKAHQKKIFDRFYQVNTLQRKGALGIGLYICSQIVKLHNGKISVESKKGHGSTFSISLPY